MATTLSINQCNASLGWDYENTTAWGANVVNASAFSFSKTLTSGTGSGAAQRVYVNTLTITTGSTSTITLDSFTDPLGTAATVMTKVKVIYINITTTSGTGTIEVAGTFAVNTGSFLSGTTPKLLLRQGGWAFLGCTDATGYTVTATTGNTLTIKNNDAASIAVNVIVVGE